MRLALAALVARPLFIEAASQTSPPFGMTWRSPPPHQRSRQGKERSARLVDWLELLELDRWHSNPGWRGEIGREPVWSGRSQNWRRGRQQGTGHHSARVDHCGQFCVTLLLQDALNGCPPFWKGRPHRWGQVMAVLGGGKDGRYQPSGAKIYFRHNGYCAQSASERNAGAGAIGCAA